MLLITRTFIGHHTYVSPDCGHCVPLVRGYSLVYLFEAPQQDMNVKREA